MAYFPVDSVDDIIKGCRNILTVLCSMYPMWDWYRKFTVLSYLAEYIVVLHRNTGRIVDGYYYVEHDKVIKDYDVSIRGSVGTVLHARDLTIHLPETKDQIRLWDRAWNDGRVENVLRYEGFLSNTK